jgi:protein TonB
MLHWKRSIPTTILLIGFAVLPLNAAEIGLPSALKKVRHQVRPEYPRIARLNRMEGAGVFRLDVDPQTGTVTKVTTVETTGHQVLDDAAIQAFRKWRFAPGVIHAVKIPIRFSIDKGYSLGLPEIGANAIYTPVPPYPPDGSWWDIRSTGQFLVIVNFETGEVEDVKVLQTIGDGRFDRSVTSTLRKWRFRPRTTHSFKMPFSFR